MHKCCVEVGIVSPKRLLLFFLFFSLPFFPPSFLQCTLFLSFFFFKGFTVDGLMLLFIVHSCILFQQKYDESALFVPLSLSLSL